MSIKITDSDTLNKRFTHYVAENKTEYKYTIKFAVPLMTDEMIDCIESSLKRYELRSASAFRNTPIQENPLDFPNIKNMPVYIAEIVMGYPASLDFLRVYLGNSVGLSTAQIAIYSENDPRQIETDLFLDRSSPEFKDDYVAVLDPSNPAYAGDAAVAAKDESMYGTGYNTPFLKELEKVRKERDITVVKNALMPGEDIDHSTLPAGYDNFNDTLPKDDVGLFGRMKQSTKPKSGGIL